MKTLALFLCGSRGRKPLRNRAAARFASLVSALLALAHVMLIRRAHAGEVQFALGPSGVASTWRGDYGGGGGMRLGYRFANLVAIDAVTRESYLHVDNRLATFLSVGLSLFGKLGPLRPYVRGYLVHQHEQSVGVTAARPFESLLGVADGIRHRGGFGGSLGLDVTVHKERSIEWFIGGAPDVTAFPDDRGPTLYVTLGVWAGLNYAL